MRVKLMLAFLAIAYSLCAISSNTSGQTGNLGRPENSPLGVTDVMKIFTLSQDTIISDEEAIQFAVQLVGKRCVDFDDDGTNHWVLKLSGSTDELMSEIEKCRSTERKKVGIVGLLPLDKAQTQLQQQRLIVDLFRLLYRKKDLASRKNTIVAGKEYIRRYDRDLDTDEFLQYLKKTLPLLEQKLEKM